MCFLPQAPEGENQPSTEVDLFISTEKIMVLNTDLKVSAGNSHNRSCWAAEYFILRIYYALLTSNSQRDLSLSVPLLSESFCSNVRPFLPPSVVSTAQFTSRMGMPLIIYCGSSVKSFGHVLNNLLLLLLPLLA